MPIDISIMILVYVGIHGVNSLNEALHISRGFGQQEIMK